jgi:hypothetical protein
VNTAFLKYFFAFILCFVIELSIAQLPDLIPYRKGNLWGYCDSNKVVKIEPKYNWVEPFSKNNIAITYNKFDERYDTEVFYLIDSLGKEIFAFDIAYGDYNGYLFLRNTNLEHPYFDSTFVFNAITKEGQFFYALSLDKENKFGAFCKSDSIVVITHDNSVIVFKSLTVSCLQGYHHGLITILNIDDEKYRQEIVPLKNNRFFICTDTSGKFFVLYCNGEVQYLNSKFKVYEFDNLNNTIIEDTDGFKLFDSTGKQIYQAKYKLTRDYYSVNYYIESVSKPFQASYKPQLYNLINNKGKKVITNITTEDLRKISHINDSEFILYKQENGCQYCINPQKDTIFKSCNSKVFNDYGRYFIYIEDSLGNSTVLDSNFNTLIKGKWRVIDNFYSYDWRALEDSTSSLLLHKSGKSIEIPVKGYINHIEQVENGCFLVQIDRGSGYSSLIISGKGKLLFVDTTSFYCDIDRSYGANIFSINRYKRVNGKEVLSSRGVLFADTDTIFCVNLPGENKLSDMRFYNSPEPNLWFNMVGSKQVIPNVDIITFMLQNNSEPISAYMDKYGTVYYDE